MLGWAQATTIHHFVENLFLYEARNYLVNICEHVMVSQPFTERLVVMRTPGGRSLGPDEVEEHAMVVVLQVGQVVGKVSEVVADPGLQILADVIINRCQRAAAALIDIRELKHSHFGQAIPLPEESPVHP